MAMLMLVEGGKSQGKPESQDWSWDLRDGRLHVRQRAALHLAQSPEEARRHVGAVAAALGDVDAQVRRASALALAQVGPQALDALVVALGHGRAVAREWAAVLLGGLGPAARNAVPALEQATHDPEWEVRQAAREALRATGKGAAEPARQGA